MAESNSDSSVATEFDLVNNAHYLAEAELKVIEEELISFLKDDPIELKALTDSLERLQLYLDRFRTAADKLVAYLDSSPRDQKEQTAKNLVVYDRVERVLRRGRKDLKRASADRADTLSGEELPNLLQPQETGVEGKVTVDDKGHSFTVTPPIQGTPVTQQQLDPQETDNTINTIEKPVEMNGDLGNGANVTLEPRNDGGARQKTGPDRNVEQSLDWIVSTLGDFKSVFDTQNILMDNVSRNLADHIKASKVEASIVERRVSDVERSIAEIRERLPAAKALPVPVEPLRPVSSRDASSEVQESEGVKSDGPARDRLSFPVGESTRLSFEPDRRSFGSNSQPDLSIIWDVMQQNNTTLQQNSTIIDSLATLITANTQSQIDTRVVSRLPRHELITFDGDPTKYQRFKDTFEEAVDKKETDDCAKLNILFHYCSVNVQLVLSGCMNRKNKKEAYKAALELLDERYGNSFLVCKSWAKRLLVFPPPRTASELERFAAELMTCDTTLTELGVAEYMNDDMHMQMVLTKLPMFLQIKWRTRFHDGLEDKKPTKFADFVKMVVRAAKEATYPMYSADCLSTLAPIATQYQQAFGPGRSSKSHPLRTTMMIEDHVIPDEELDFYQSAMVDLVEEADPGVQMSAAVSREEQQRKIIKPRIKMGCPCCSAKHYLARCQTFIRMSPAERLRFVRQQGLCINCFSRQHKALDCQSRGYCNEGECGARHNTVLHYAFVVPIGLNSPPNPPVVAMTVAEGTPASVDISEAELQALQRQASVSSSASSVEASNAIVTLMTPTFSTTTFLPVTPVFVRGVSGWVVAYALLDTGSSASFCTKRLVRKLGVGTMGPATMRVSTMSTATDLSGERVSLRMTAFSGRKLQEAKHMLAIDDLPISSQYIVTPDQLASFDHLSHLHFPSVSSEQIDMLIGQDNAGLIKPKDRIDGISDDEPYGVRTNLGWTINGLFPSASDPSTVATSCLCTGDVPAMKDEEITIQEKLDRLWEIENAEYVKPMSADDLKVKKLWDESFYIEDGHMHLPIPFKDESPNLPNNYPLAERRLHQVSRRLEKDPILKEKYLRAMNDYIESGYAESVPDMSVGETGMINYSCHHAVEREDKPDVARVVYDFSALFLGVCLNLLVHSGPNFTNNLVDIIIRFRQFEVFVMGDIKAMFNRVRVPPKHRDVMRFLWWKDGIIGGEIVCFRMITHAFGGIWSPSACMYALTKLVELYGDSYDRETCDALLRSFYVDDCLRSVIGAAAGVRLLNQLRELLWRIGFLLTKFSSNHVDVIRALPAADLAKGFEKFHTDLTQVPMGKALGAGLNARDDVFIVRVIRTNKPMTKRGMLGLLSSVFDPLGILAPFVAKARALFQKLCGPCSVGWDDVIPDAILGTWQGWIEDLEVVKSFTLPRCISLGHGAEFQLRLHAFADASQTAYAAVIYAVVESRTGGVTSLLLMAKTKLAPLKMTSIPRLELCGAVLATRLMRTVTRALDIPVLERHYWTDSMIVYCSIRAESRVFKTFVGNRLAVIQNLSQPEMWHHVPTQMNPADLPSRGCGAQELLDSLLWKTGPEFLVKTRDEWPVIGSNGAGFDANERRTVREMACYATMMTGFKFSTSRVFQEFLREFPDWYRLQRAAAWLRRFLLFLAKGKTKCPIGFITPREMLSARVCLVKVAQAEISVEQRQAVAFRKLFIFSEDGVFRVGGRLKHARDVDYQVRHPMVLPTRHDLTKLIIRSAHEENGHVGSERTLDEVRRHFWILSSRKAIRQVLSKCAVCRRLRSAPQEQLMAELPADRVQPGLPPFSCTGIDFAGPFKVKLGRKTYTRYICVFTCFNTRAFHVEIAPSLDITAFLNALHRFICRRGVPRRIYSDNGTNFVGGRNVMREEVRLWNLKQIHDFMLRKDVEWSFNTPYASHHGGVWERMIRTFRAVFLGLVTEHVLTDDSLQTLACLAEKIVNGRPLTKLSSDVHDDAPLRPCDLLILNTGSTCEPVGTFDRRDLLGDRWKKSQYLADQFWSRWTRQYLPLLQARQKWREEKRNLRVGDLVMLRDETMTTRMQWPLGLVVETYPDTDGMVRSVDVRTKKGTYRRAITKLHLLEGDD